MGGEGEGGQSVPSISPSHMPLTPWETMCVAIHHFQSGLHTRMFPPHFLYTIHIQYHDIVLCITDRIVIMNLFPIITSINFIPTPVAMFQVVVELKEESRDIPDPTENRELQVANYVGPTLIDLGLYEWMEKHGGMVTYDKI